jgi:uncharacterized lipoprotein
MNKKIALISLLLIGVLASCSVIPQFQQAREQYVETRTAELLAEMPTTEPLPTEVVEATPKVEPTANQPPRLPKKRQKNLPRRRPGSH